MSSPVVAAAVAAGLSLLVLPAAQAQTAPREIGTLGGRSSWAQAINALGVVVGTSETPEGSFRAFIAARPGALTGLGPDNVPGVGLGINDLNDVVGSSDRAFARIGGRLRELGSGLANDISNARQSAGWSNVTPEETHAVVWDAAGRMRDLGQTGEQSFASALNDRGQVAGWIADAAGQPHAVRWEADGSRIELGTLGGRYSQALAINEAGDVAGVSETAGGIPHAFVWRRGSGMVDLGEDLQSSTAFGLNDSGQVVGERVTEDGRRRAFVWSAGSGLMTLDTPARPDAASRANAINDLGEIAGLVAGPTEARALVWIVRASPAAQVAGLEGLIRQLIRDRVVTSRRASSPLAHVRSAARAIRAGRLDRAASHLRTAARQLSGVAPARSRARVTHLRTIAERVAVLLAD